MRENTSLALDQNLHFCSCRQESLLLDAELELKSFARAVTKLHGPDEALRAIKDWVEECERLPWPDNGSLDWRQVTIAAAIRLSERVGKTQSVRLVPRISTARRAG
jgi:hypothetical protein